MQQLNITRSTPTEIEIPPVMEDYDYITRACKRRNALNKAQITREKRNLSLELEAQKWLIAFELILIATAIYLRLWYL